MSSSTPTQGAKSARAVWLMVTTAVVLSCVVLLLFHNSLRRVADAVRTLDVIQRCSSDLESAQAARYDHQLTLIRDAFSGEIAIRELDSPAWSEQCNRLAEAMVSPEFDSDLVRLLKADADVEQAVAAASDWSHSAAASRQTSSGQLQAFMTAANAMRREFLRLEGAERLLRARAGAGDQGAQSGHSVTTGSGQIELLDLIVEIDSMSLARDPDAVRDFEGNRLSPTLARLTTAVDQLTTRFPSSASLHEHLATLTQALLGPPSIGEDASVAAQAPMGLIQAALAQIKSDAARIGLRSQAEESEFLLRRAAERLRETVNARTIEVRHGVLERLRSTLEIATIASIVAALVLAAIGRILALGCRRRAIELEQTIQDLQESRAQLVDVNELRKANQEIEQANDELQFQRRSLDYASIVSETDAKGIITYANENFCRLSGYDCNKLIGRTHKVVNSGHHTKEFWSDVFATLRQTGVWQGTICNRTKDGSLYWVQSTIVAFRGADGEISRYVSIRTDVTALVRAEAELVAALERAEAGEREMRVLHDIAVPVTRASTVQGVLESSLEALCRAGSWTVGHAYQPSPDDDTRLVSSHAWHASEGGDPESLSELRRDLETTTIERNDGICGRAWAQRVSIWADDLCRDTAQRHAKAVASLGLRSAVALPVLCGGEVKAVLELFSTEKRSPSPALDQLIELAAIEIGRALAQRATEGQLRNATLAAEAANRAKSEFLAAMSHEIRTPLNGVVGMIDLVCGSKLTEQQRSFLGLAKSSANSLTSVINDILDFSKMEAGKLELCPVDFDLLGLAEDVLVVQALRAHEKKVELSCSMDPTLVRCVRGDSDRLRQILINLIGNAVKFTSEGSVSVRITLEERRADGPLVRVAITDTGVGIPPEKLDRLFQAFSQADSSTSRQYGGTGLGLVISKRLAELMGGSIGVTSQQGTGSTFWFTAQFESVEGASAPAPSTLSSVRMLLVGGSDTQRRALCEQIVNWNARVDDAADAERAMTLLTDAAARNDPFTVAIVNSELSGTTAADFAARVRAQPALSHTPLLLLHPITQPVAAQQIRADGFVGSVTTPTRQSLLFDAIVAATAGLPSDVTDAVQPEPSVDPANNGSAPVATHRVRSVLLAEDNEINQIVAKEILTKAGYQCHIVSDGKQAVEAVQRVGADFDLVLMDCQMPGMDGFEAARTIRKLEASGQSLLRLARLPIVALTANAMKGDRELCLSAGMDAYATKPIVPEDLLRTIEQVLSVDKPNTRRAA